MIDEKILDQILPVPTIEALRDEKVEELRQDGFVITNFASGGIFYHLAMIMFRCRIELLRLLRSVVNDMFVVHSRGLWLELKGADFSKKRKQALKSVGYVTISRVKSGEAIKIAKGHIFKTIRDINGDELRYFAVEQTVLQKDVLACQVIVEAEKEGAIYNVPPGQIIRSLTHIEGIDKIENAEGWIIHEGANVEEYESLRSRTLGAWAELSTLPIADKYKNVCEGVPGVLFVNVHDRHPRGQGTVDIIVTGTAGQATEALLQDVRKAADSIRGPYDNILVKSSVTVPVDIRITVTVPALIDSAGLDEKAASVVTDFLQINRKRILNELVHAELIHTLMERLPELRNVRVTLPADDVFLDPDKVILPGRIEVTVQKV